MGGTRSRQVELPQVHTSPAPALAIPSVERSRSIGCLAETISMRGASSVRPVLGAPCT